jgi:iron complex outermembrane receptor protein
MFLAGAAWAGLTFGHVTAANAQAAAQADNLNAPEEIVVTAQRRAEKLQDVPVSITAITAATLEKQDVRGIEDYFALVPNVSFVTAGSRDRKDISIRGISNQLDPYNDARQATYAFYIDDFNVVALTSNPQIADLERIEVLRGPQGTFFGRNAEGGAINISTNKPSGEYHAEFGLDVSSFNTVKVDAMIDAPVVDQKLAIRVSANSETSDGNIKNINPIGGGNDSQYYSFRGIARFTPTDNITWDTTLSFAHENEGMRDGVPTGYLTATWRSVYYHNAPGFVANPDGVGFYPNNTNEVNFNTPQAVGDEYEYVDSRAVVKFDDTELTVVGGYGQSHVYNIGDVDGGSFDYFNEVDHINRDTLNAEIRLQSIGDGPFEWNIGTNVGDDTGSTNQVTAYGSQAITLGFNHPAGFPITANYNTEDDFYTGLFAQGTYHITDTLSATIGGRYSYEHLSGQFKTLSNGATTVNDPRLSATFRDFSPKFNVSYKPVEDLLVYATISKGFKSGGVQAASIGIANSFLPETLWNYEAGVKYDLFDHRLRLDVAAFYEDWTNVQQQIRFQYLNALGQLASVTGVANAAAAHSKGVEGSADFRVTNEIKLNAHAGYADAIYESYPNALVDGTVINATGKPLVDAPKWTLGAQASYERNVYEDYDGFGQLEWNYRSKMLSSIYALRYNTFPFISPGYSNFNLRVGVENDKIRAVFYVENLLNAKYFQNAYEKAFYSGVQVDPSYQRIGVSFDYKY